MISKLRWDPIPSNLILKVEGVFNFSDSFMLVYGIESKDSQKNGDDGLFVFFSVEWCDCDIVVNLSDDVELV